MDMIELALFELLMQEPYTNFASMIRIDCDPLEWDVIFYYHKDIEELINELIETI